MGKTKITTKVSDSPIMAKSNKHIIRNVQKKQCESCKSKNTVCIYYNYAGSIMGYDSDMEVYCNDCGKYTLYHEEFDA